MASTPFGVVITVPALVSVSRSSYVDLIVYWGGLGPGLGWVHLTSEGLVPGRASGPSGVGVGWLEPESLGLGTLDLTPNGPK